MFSKKLVFAFYLHSFAFYNKLFTSLLSFILLESNYLPLYLRFTITTNWTTITTLEVVHCPRFEYSIFTLHRPPEGCRGVLRSTFWRNFFDRVSDRLLGSYTILVQPVLSSAVGRTRSCPRSLSLTLLKKKHSKM